MKRKSGKPHLAQWNISAWHQLLVKMPVGVCVLPNMSDSVAHGSIQISRYEKVQSWDLIF